MTVRQQSGREGYLQIFTEALHPAGGRGIDTDTVWIRNRQDGRRRVYTVQRKSMENFKTERHENRNIVECGDAAESSRS